MELSIIIPIYNTDHHYLQECLHSVLMQTLRRSEYEIILVDDCSTDRQTLATIDKYVSFSSNIQVVRHRGNYGPNEARYSGVKAASGDYIVFVDGDDILSRDAIEKLRMRAVTTNADLVVAPVARWNDKTKTYSHMPSHGKAFPQNYIPRLQALFSGQHSWSMCGRLFQRTILSKDVFDIPYHTLHEDMITFSRIMYKSKVVSSINELIYYYRVNTDGITYDFHKRNLSGLLLAIDDWIENAKRHKIFDELSTKLAEGAEKYISLCIQRTIYSKKLSFSKKLEFFEVIRKRYLALPFPLSSSHRPEIRFISYFAGKCMIGNSEELMEVADQFNITHRPPIDNVASVLKNGMGPSEMARRLKDKIVLICEVDYHVRSAATFARELRLLGYPCVVLDNSVFASNGLRQLRPDERDIFWRTEYIKIHKPPYGIDWLSTPRLVIMFNDFNNYFREALEYRNRLGLESATLIEGINDFLRVDFEGYRNLPYRRCNNVFLAGDNDKKYFEDRNTYLIGLPVIEKLCTKSPSFPSEPLAVLNVNFTFGSHEDKRDNFISQAKNAFAKTDYDWIITQHPMDSGKLADLPVSDRTQYEQIDEGTVFVSRFATGILEALASGKPAIYFNPHGESVDKFKNPLGAFELANNEDELANALRKVLVDIQAGVDFRTRALPFLRHHTGFSPEGPSASERFTDAVAQILKSDGERRRSVSKLFFKRLNEQGSFSDNTQGLIFGSLDRRHYAQLDEAALIGRYFGERGNLMIDVGANIGNCADIFLGKGWTVHAFEPDPDNQKKLQELGATTSRLIINEEAVSDKVGLKLPFFSSEESTGISSLSAFTPGHKKVCEVLTTTLRDYCKNSKIRHVDFLKVDVEGYDKFVLDGFPWNEDKPDIVLVEFEDYKTVQQGYTTDDLADTMIHQGYNVYVSEWLPIIRYGLAHDWRRLIRYSPELNLEKAWGNLIGFLKEPDETELKSLAQETIKFAARPKIPNSVNTIKQNRPFYADFADKLKARSPRIFRVLQHWRRRFVDIPRRFHVAYSNFAHWIRTNSPVVFRLGQMVAWTVRDALRHKRLIFGMFALALTFGLLPNMYTLAWPYRIWLWGFAGFFVFTLAAWAAIVIMREGLRRAIRSVRQSGERRVEKLMKISAEKDAENDSAIKSTRAELAVLSFSHAKLVTAMEAEQVMLEGKVTSIQSDITDIQSEIANIQSEATGFQSDISNIHSEVTSIRSNVTSIQSQDVLVDILSTLRALFPPFFGGNAVDAYTQSPIAEHGHALLIAVLADEERARPGAIAGKTLIEIGSTRENHPAQRSTEKFAIFTALTRMKFVTVDMDPLNTLRAKQILDYLNIDGQAITQRGEDFLNLYSSQISVIYLDAFDFNHGMHSEQRRERYREILKTDINDDACHKMHEVCAKSIIKKMPIGGFVAIDDTWKDKEGKYAGKGKLAMPLFLDNSFKIVARTDMSIVLKKVE